MDISTVALISPDVVQSAGDMFQLALMSCDKPPKVIAQEVGCSVDSIYSAARGIRAMPVKVRQKLAGVSCIAAAAIALEATGFARWFGYQKVDRHIQSMIVRLRAKDREVDKLLDALPTLLLDKHGKEDFTAEEYTQLEAVACNLVDLTCNHTNLIMELEVKYKLNITPYLQGIEKPPVRQTQTV